MAVKGGYQIYPISIEKKAFRCQAPIRLLTVQPSLLTPTLSKLPIYKVQPHRSLQPDIYLPNTLSKISFLSLLNVLYNFY
jgi:hypothetical protein